MHRCRSSVTQSVGGSRVAIVVDVYVASQVMSVRRAAGLLIGRATGAVIQFDLR